MATQPDPTPATPADAPAITDASYRVTSTLTVLGKPAGAVITASTLEVAGCNIPALIAAGHLTEE